MKALLIVAIVAKAFIGLALAFFAATGIVVDIGTHPAAVDPIMFWPGLGHFALSLIWAFTHRGDFA